MSTNETRIQLLSECSNSWNYLVSYLTLHLPYFTLRITSLYFTLHHTLTYLTYITLPYLTLPYLTYCLTLLYFTSYPNLPYLQYLTLPYLTNLTLPYNLTLRFNVFPFDYLTLHLTLPHLM